MNSFGDKFASKNKKEPDPMQTVLERLEKLEKETAKEKREKQELIEKLAKVEETAKKAEEESGIASMRKEVIHEEVIPYPINSNKPKYIQAKESEFQRYGVGVRPIRFDFIGKSSDLNSINMIPRVDRVVYNGQVINLAYCRNHESPFVIDHPDGDWIAEIGPIIFDGGMITVYPNDPGLQRFLLSHSKYGTKWKVYDEEEISKEFNSKYEKIDAAALELMGMFNHEDTNMPRYFGFFVLGAHKAVHLNTETLKRELREAVMNNPDLVDSFDRNEGKIKYIFALAHTNGFLIQKENRIYFNDGRILCNIEGKDIYEGFYNYCKRNPGTVQEVKEKVGLK